MALVGLMVNGFVAFCVAYSWAHRLAVAAVLPGPSLLRRRMAWFVGVGLRCVLGLLVQSPPDSPFWLRATPCKRQSFIVLLS